MILHPLIKMIIITNALVVVVVVVVVVMISGRGSSSSSSSSSSNGLCHNRYGFDEWVFWHLFIITVNYNSPHI
jgi:hypothetical protein